MDRVSSGGSAGMDRCSLNNRELIVSTGIRLIEVSRKPQITDNTWQPPNTACTRLGVCAAFLGSSLAWADSRFEGESTLPPQAGNARR